MGRVWGRVVCPACVRARRLAGPRAGSVARALAICRRATSCRVPGHARASAPARLAELAVWRRGRVSCTLLQQVHCVYGHIVTRLATLRYNEDAFEIE